MRVTIELYAQKLDCRYDVVLFYSCKVGQPDYVQFDRCIDAVISL